MQLDGSRVVEQSAGSIRSSLAQWFAQRGGSFNSRSRGLPQSRGNRAAEPLVVRAAEWLLRDRHQSTHGRTIAATQIAARGTGRTPGHHRSRDCTAGVASRRCMPLVAHHLTSAATRPADDYGCCDCHRRITASLSVAGQRSRGATGSYRNVEQCGPDRDNCTQPFTVTNPHLRQQYQPQRRKCRSSRSRWMTFCWTGADYAATSDQAVPSQPCPRCSPAGHQPTSFSCDVLLNWAWMIAPAAKKKNNKQNRRCRSKYLDASSSSLLQRPSQIVDQVIDIFQTTDRRMRLSLMPAALRAAAS